MQELRKGNLLQGGKYKIEEVLGQGGFGITYRAKMRTKVQGDIGSMDVEVDVAVKEFFIKERCVRDETTSHVSIPSEGGQELVALYRRKFIKEARNMASMHHPHIVKVTDVFEENGTVYYVMQYLPGGSLSAYVRSQQTGRLSEAEALRLIRQIGSALHYMHSEKHTCHLDVKPGNVLMDAQGNAVLIDFGLSKNYDDSGNQTSSTPVGVSKGYAPLEQYQQSLMSFSPQTDVYSLGATLYFLLTGVTPPEASLVNEEGLPTCPSNISPSIWQVIEKAMQPRRKDRYGSVDEMLQAMPGGAGEQETTVFEPSSLHHFSQTVSNKHESGVGVKRKWPFKKMVIGLCALAVLLGIVAFIWFEKRATSDSDNVYSFRRVGECPLKDVLNPMDGGIILGWTTIDEAVAAGGVPETRADKQHTVAFNNRNYWDHEGDGIITSLYFTNSEGLPTKWQEAGLAFDFSYNQWLSWLESNGFDVYVEKAPDSSSGSLYAKVSGKNRVADLKIELIFNYSEKTSVTDAGTLHSIALSRPRIQTSTTSLAPYFPFEGVTLGITTIDQLRQMGMTVKIFGDRNESTYGSLGEYYFYNDFDGGEIVRMMSVDNNLLPQSWISSEESCIMTYNLWLKFFADRGFVIMENEPQDKPSAAYPSLKAVQPELGLSVNVSFDKINIATEGDSPEKVRGYAIKKI